MESIKKEAHIKNKKSLRQLGMMIFITIMIQATGLIRSSILAAQFGISIEIDALNFSNNINVFIFSFISSGITTVLIPSLVEDGNNKAIDTFITTIYSLALIILVFVFIFRVPIITIISGRNQEFIKLSSNIMFITLFTNFLNSFLGVTNAVFQCEDKFNIPKIMNLLTSIILIIMLLVMPSINIYKYVGALFITTLINVILNFILVIKTSFRFKISWDLKNKKFMLMIKTFLPTLLSTGLYQVTLITDTLISSRLGEGKISILNYSNSIISMINMLLLTNIMTYLYPKISKSVNQNRGDKSLLDYFIFLNGLMMIIVIEFVILGKDAIRILYERGKFTGSMTEYVYICSLIAILSLPTNALRDLIYRYFYANKDTLTPFKNSILISCVNIIISIVLSIHMGLYGIILGTVLSSYLSLFMIMARFNKKFNIKYNKNNLILENMKILIAAIVVLLIVNIQGYKLFDNILINIVIIGTEILSIYLVLLYILKSKIFRIKI